MKIDYLPTEGEENYTMYAFYDEANNEVIWNGVSENGSSSYHDHICGTEYAQFFVWRRGKAVIVEGCGWYSSDFHFRLEITDEPNHVVILAHQAAALMDAASE